MFWNRTFDFLVVLTIALILIVSQLLKIDFKSQLGYFSTQSLAVLMEIDYLDTFRFEFGQAYFMMVSFIVYVISFKIIRSLFSQMYTRKVYNPYNVKLGCGGQIFYFSCGIFEFNETYHPTLETADPLKLSQDGTNLVTNHANMFFRDLMMLLNEVHKSPYLKFALIKLKTKSKLYTKFGLVAYVIQHSKIGLSKNNLLYIEKLQSNQPRFTRLKLNQLSDRKISKLIKYDPDKKDIYINPKTLQTEFKLPFTEIGIYEFEILNNLVKWFNKNIMKLRVLDGEYYIGDDVLDQPVFIDKPQSILYTGRCNYLQEVLKFNFIKNPIVVTDDSRLIARLRSQLNREPENKVKQLRHSLEFYLLELKQYVNKLKPYLERISKFRKPETSKHSKKSEKSQQQGETDKENQEIEEQISKQIIKINNLRLNLIKYHVNHPRFFRICIRFWEHYLPDSAKTGSRDAISASLIEFLELRYLLEGKDINNKLLLRDLMDTNSYKEFNQDISNQVFTKFNGIFNMPLFSDQSVKAISSSTTNKMPNRIGFSRFFDDFEQSRFKILSLCDLNLRQKNAIFIMLMIMMDQALFPDNWLIFSFQQESNLEYLARELSKTIQFNNIVLNFRSISYSGNWLNNFILQLADSHLQNSKLKQSLFGEFPEIEDAVYLRNDFFSKTILKFRSEDIN